MHVRKIIFFGAQGKGKSTVLNSSAGSLISQSKPSADFIALTKELQHKNVGSITYCDTPGFMTAKFWSSVGEKEKEHIQRHNKQAAEAIGGAQELFI